MVAALKLGGGCDCGVQKGDEQEGGKGVSCERQHGYTVNGKRGGVGWSQGGVGKGA